MISTGMPAGFWVANNVQVVVASSDEADRIATAMGPRAARQIRIVRPDKTGPTPD